MNLNMMSDDDDNSEQVISVFHIGEWPVEKTYDRNADITEDFCEEQKFPFENSGISIKQ